MPTEKEKKKIIVKLIIESKRMRTRPDNRNLKKTGANHPRCNLDIEFVNVSPFFLFRLSQSAAARLSSHFTPPYTTPHPHRWWHSALVFFARAKTKLSRPGMWGDWKRATRRWTAALSSSPRKRKRRRHSWRKCVYPSRAFFLFHVHLHGNVTWSFNRSSFILTTFILSLFFFCLAHFSNERWQMMWFHIQSWLDALASITESNRVVVAAVGHRALCQGERDCLTTHLIISRSLSPSAAAPPPKTIDRFVPSFRHDPSWTKFVVSNFLLFFFFEKSLNSDVRQMCRHRNRFDITIRRCVTSWTADEPVR